MNGNPSTSNDPCKSSPEKTGLVEDPTLRAREVTLAAAVRSDGSTRASKTFDGRWVKTIVLSSPKRRASGTAARNESAERRFAPKNRAERVVSETPKRRWKKSAIRLCTTTPPEAASTLKSAVSRHTIPPERPNGGTRRCQMLVTWIGACRGASTGEDSRRDSPAATSASAAYSSNSRRIPEARGNPACVSRSGSPAAKAPSAALSEATRL